MSADILNINDFAASLAMLLGVDDLAAWEIVANIDELVRKKISTLGSDYTVNNAVAIHRSATIEAHAILKPPVIISEKCFVAAHCLMRGGVFVGPGAIIGPGSEVKSSIILNNSALAHFNFAGDSVIGSNVNMEAGSVIANHFNEREDKTISVVVNGKKFIIPSKKFGALVGDNSRIGANAVLSPGTILKPGSIVKRLELVDQCA
jgi:NDP-sugar pyrophosphorylase family protein